MAHPRATKALGLAAVLLALLGAAYAWFVHAPMPAIAASEAQARTVIVGGRQRSYLVWTPPALPAGAPVLLVLHGSLMDGPQMRRMLGPRFERLAHRHGAVVVYPTGFEGHFNEGRLAATYSARTLDIDDVGFVRAIVDALAAGQGIDRRRIYAFGYSNGGAMALRLVTQVPELVTGAIANSALVPTADNLGWPLAPQGAASAARVVLLAGTRDAIVPYDGGAVTIFGFGNRGTVLSAPASARWLATRAGLAAEPDSTSQQTVGALAVQQQDWGLPSRIRLVTVLGGGHTVPQTDYRFPRFLGSTLADDRLLDEAWQMLEAR